MTTTATTKQARITKIAERIEEYWRELEELATDAEDETQSSQALDRAVNLLSDAVTALEHVKL